jgi:hypothetical protein
MKDETLERLSRLADRADAHARGVAGGGGVVLADAGEIIGTIDVESDRANAEDEQFLRSCAIALARLWRSRLCS